MDKYLFYIVKHVSAISIIILLICAGGCGRASVKNRTGSDSPPDPWEADSLAYNYWGSPASPYRDESRYISFLDSLLTIESLPDALRERCECRRRIAMLNRPGSIAGDFEFLERGGYESRLHDLKCPLTLLFFYDPECPHCNDIQRLLASSTAINRAIAEDKLIVIAIYAEGKREIWDKTRNDMPDNWLVGYDITGILDQEIYDLPAMPTPYLLDSDKRVILKDPTPDQLINRINSHL